MIISILLSGFYIPSDVAQKRFFLCLFFISLPLAYAVYKLSKQRWSIWTILSIIVCGILLFISLFFLFIFSAFGF